MFLVVDVRELNYNNFRGRKTPHPVDEALGKNLSKSKARTFMQDMMTAEKKRVEGGLQAGSLLLFRVSQRRDYFRPVIEFI